MSNAMVASTTNHPMMTVIGQQQQRQQQRNQQYGKVNEETLASCSRTLNASFEKALELSAVNISTDTSPTEQSSNMSLPSVRQMAKDFEEKRKIFKEQQQQQQQQQLDNNNNNNNTSAVLSNFGMPLSPIPMKNDSEESPLAICEKCNHPGGPTKQTCLIITTPPKILRKDADCETILSSEEQENSKNTAEYVNEKDLFDTPDKQAFLSEAPFQYDTPPQKKLFGDDNAIYFGHLVPSTGVENEVDTPKTCNTSNLSSSFLVSQIAFDPNKTNPPVDPEESFETFYSQDSNANRKRSYFDDTFDSSTDNIQEKDLPSSRKSSTLFGRAENLFYSQVDTLVDKFVMACVQEKDIVAPGRGVNTKKKKKSTRSGKKTTTTTTTTSEDGTTSRQPRVANV
ncbi:unnamed protein product [Cylindrotheca closterium]|uniref:Condensin complex subunit 2 n=1 Tax=Cylindrotheca closterium TaxID=2856 RepID=A0AAD2CNE4_9STRA|nr:unnamed protein product [Cylindrotheca closterium]